MSSSTETSPGAEAGAAEAAVGLVATGRVRRHEFVYANDDRFAPTALVPAPPPRPVKPPAPLGELATASAEEVASLVTEALGGARDTRNHNRWGIRGLLAHLERYPGQTWQQRWESAGLNEPGTTVTTQATMVSPTLRRRLNAAAGHAFAVRLVQPSLRAFRSYLFSCYPRWFRTVARDPVLEDFSSRVEALPVSRERHHDALFDVCCALTVFGIELADLTPEALLHYATECRKYGLTRGTRPGEGSFAGTQAWPVLYDMGQFPASAPRTLRVAVTKGQRSISELVDRHRLRNTDVRDLLVDYITRRATELDYAATEHLARYLARTFWKQIETINPSQADLRLDENTIAAWKQWLRTLPGGQPRLNVDGPMVAIRSLYLDLHTWAAAEPERWARWVAPSPIRDADLRKFSVRRRRLQERMAHRTRERQPLLPILSNHVNDHWTRLQTLLDTARRRTRRAVHR